MPPQWISAKTALDIFAEISGEALAIMAMCRGAHLGIYKSRARSLSVSGRLSHDAPIPTEFWWAEGAEGLKQDWNLGDFETWLNQNSLLQAQGVEFDFSDIRESLEPENAAIIARRLSVAGNPAWMNAQDARTIIHTNMGASALRAGDVLIEQCKLGFIAAKAIIWQQTSPGMPHDWAIEEREKDIPAWFWSDFLIPKESSQDWEIGTFLGHGMGPDGVCWITLKAVHFYRPSIDAIKVGVPVAQITENKPRPAGRPPAAFWDDLWNEIWGRVYEGDFNPKRQSEIEAAMLQWASDNGHKLSVSVARERARKMWARYQREAGNS